MRRAGLEARLFSSALLLNLVLLDRLYVPDDVVVIRRSLDGLDVALDLVVLRRALETVDVALDFVLLRRAIDVVTHFRLLSVAGVRRFLNARRRVASKSSTPYPKVQSSGR
jgi:hypothetical protein